MANTRDPVSIKCNIMCSQNNLSTIFTIFSLLAPFQNNVFRCHDGVGSVGGWLGGRRGRRPSNRVGGWGLAREVCGGTPRIL